MKIFCGCLIFFFFKQKTAYEMRISDWSSDVCSSDLERVAEALELGGEHQEDEAQREDEDEYQAGASVLELARFAVEVVADLRRQHLMGDAFQVVQRLAAGIDGCQVAGDGGSEGMVEAGIVLVSPRVAKLERESTRR